MRENIRKLMDKYHDRSLPIEERIGMMFISVGIIASFIGMILCLLVSASLPATVSVFTISAVCIATMAFAFKMDRFTFVRDVMVYSLIILMPIIFVGAGGMNSGVPAWQIYTMFFITLGCKGAQLWFCLAVCFVSDFILFLLDYLDLIYIYRLPNETYKFISIFGSCFIVAIAILITIYLLKRMYNRERQFLEEQSLELKRANEFERDFLATMSHELRTPINAITGFNELILNESTESQIVSYAEDVRSSSNFLITLVNDILDYSKIEAGEMQLNKEEYSVKDLATACYNVIAHRAEAKNLAVIVKVHPDMPSRLLGDVNRIQQIIINLLTNAVKYTDEGAITFVISADDIMTEDDYTCKLSVLVSDTGVGIAPEHLDTVFNSFKRVRGSGKQIEGTGLGLAIVKSLVELMGGDISVESTLGVGSRFMFTIRQPIVDPEPVGVMLFSKKTDSMGESFRIERPEVSVIPDEEKKQSVLAVDDTDTNLRVIKMLLKNERYRVDTAKSGQEAIELSKENNYDLILMDIMMPNMTGVEALEIIREFAPQQPIVALTADAVSGAKQEYLKKGFNEYLTKPINSDKLKAVIDKYL